MPVVPLAQQQSWVRVRRPFSPPPAKLGEGGKAFPPPPSKLGEGREAAGWEKGLYTLP